MFLSGRVGGDLRTTWRSIDKHFAWALLVALAPSYRAKLIARRDHELLFVGRSFEIIRV